MNRWVEIGHGREVVEILDVPQREPYRRTGRIRHANGENVAIELETLEWLMRRAEAARNEGKETSSSGASAVLRA